MDSRSVSNETKNDCFIRNWPSRERHDYNWVQVLKTIDSWKDKTGKITNKRTILEKEGKSIISALRGETKSSKGDKTLEGKREKDKIARVN